MIHLNIEAKFGACIVSIRLAGLCRRNVNVSLEIGFRMPKLWPPKAYKSCLLNHLRFMAGPRHYLG